MVGLHLGEHCTEPQEQQESESFVTQEVVGAIKNLTVPDNKISA